MASFEAILSLVSLSSLIWNLGIVSFQDPAGAAPSAFPSQGSNTNKTLSNPTPPPASDGRFVPDEVLVRFDPSTPVYAMQQCLQSASAISKRHIAELYVSQLKVPIGRTAQAIAKLKACSGVVYAELNYEVSAADTLPNDPGLVNQYGLTAIRAPQGWDLSTGVSTVTIAIVDSGVDLTHVDLAAKIVPGIDIVNNDTIPQDDYGHGTHVAGIAAAMTNDSAGIAGVSWGAKIMPVKVLNASGNGSFADVAAGIVWAADNGAQVINMSLGGSSNPPPSVLLDAVNYAYGKGVVQVAAAGNAASSVPFYPGSFPHVIAVASTDSSNNHVPSSNFGPQIAVSAPGDLIYSTLPGNNYGYLTGTSMASPFVAGLAAILKGLSVSSTTDQIAQEIESTALDLGTPGRDDLYGYGLIQMDAAIKSVSTLPLLGVHKAGTGSGTVTSAPAGIDCGDVCSAFFELNASLTLTAVPAPGSTSTGWSDSGCTGTGDCILTMDTDKPITATFTQDEYSLTITSVHGTVVKSPDQLTYHYGDVVHLTVTPAVGFVFADWSGDRSSASNPFDVTILANTSLTANFDYVLYFPLIFR